MRQSSYLLLSHVSFASVIVTRKCVDMLSMFYQASMDLATDSELPSKECCSGCCAGLCSGIYSA